jgi:hypothetical protein
MPAPFANRLVIVQADHVARLNAIRRWYRRLHAILPIGAAVLSPDTIV